MVAACTAALIAVVQLVDIPFGIVVAALYLARIGQCQEMVAALDGIADGSDAAVLAMGLWMVVSVLKETLVSFVCIFCTYMTLALTMW